MTEPSPTIKMIFTLVKERHYDSDLGPEEELGSVILNVDPADLDRPERQILALLRASGILNDEVSNDDEGEPGHDELDNNHASYYIKATPAIEADSIEEAAEDLIQRNRWLLELRTAVNPHDASTAEPTPEPERLNLSYEGTPFRTHDHLYAESTAFTPGKLNRFEFTLTPENFEGFKPGELAMTKDNGIPFLNAYIHPNGVTIRQAEASRIDLASFVPQALQDVKPGDMVVFEAPEFGVLMAAVEAGEHTTWNPNRGWLSMDISDGFDITLDLPNRFTRVRYLGVL